MLVNVDSLPHRWGFVRWFLITYKGDRLILYTFVDRDAGRWKVDFSEIQRRREAFWELYSYDLLQVISSHKS